MEVSMGQGEGRKIAPIMFVKPNFPKYSLFLFTLIGNTSLAPFLTGAWASLLASVLFFVAIIAIIDTLNLSRLSFFVYVSIAVLAFCLEAADYLSWMSGHHSILLTLMTQAVYAFFFILSIFLMVKDVYQREKITIDTILGAVCIYLSIGFIWALLYSMIATVNPEAFSHDLSISQGLSSVLYFSFTTLTTLGYGDVLPLTPLTRILTSLEAITGQIYAIVFVAILVGKYLSQK